ncbi:glycosyltransferase [uncultured Pontibacter sp.]|uniref:glycosyltransferase n=1 Tax=uncultured Pontibacter sp. TaxID=453356 RepID=UPI00261FCBF2|nr:glycosyltransferase [uncultured Pontibacter sp.]
MLKEQTEAFCRYYPSVNVGISAWGQQDEQFLLWLKDHLKNIKKYVRASTSPYITPLLPNLKVYHSPTFTWTKKILGGNMKGLIKANLQNLHSFESDYGAVDAIHAHVGFPAGMIAMEVARITKKPYCITEHMGPFPYPLVQNKDGMLSASHRQPYSEAVVNVAVSSYQAELMERQGIRNVVVIPNFVDEDVFVPSPIKATPKEPFTFFALSYIAPNKGTDLLLYAAQKLLDAKIDVLLRIGGDGPFLNTCKHIASTLGIEANIVWLGDVGREDALREFQSCDAFVLPSQYESMGIVFVEALACGKPIIATKCGGPESTVTPFNGILVDKNNIEELTQAMQSLITNYQKYDSLQIRQDFLNRFSTQAVAPQLLNLYNGLIK